MTRRAIAIGGSAGLIPVLKRLPSQMPADLDAPVFIAVHVGAEGRNVLADILNACSPCPVRTAEECMPVNCGTVYGAPPDHRLLIVYGTARLGRGQCENLAQPAIDRLFRSVAAGHGPGARLAMDVMLGRKTVE